MHWFREDFRKVLMVYVSPEWAKHRGARFDAKECIDALDAAGTGCIQTFSKDHYGYCYFKCSLGRPYPTDVIGELIAEARPRGMRVIPYFSVGFDAYATGTHPEWLHVDSHGEAAVDADGPVPVGVPELALSGLLPAADRGAGRQLRGRRRLARYSPACARPLWT